MFKQAVEKSIEATTTTNGAPAHAEVDMQNPLVQFYSRAGTYRAADDVTSGLAKYREILRHGTISPGDFETGVLSLSPALWARDPRSGLGERALGRGMFKEFEKLYGIHTPEPVVKRLMEMIVKYGRWDDLWMIGFTTDKFKNAMFSMIDEGIRSKDGLCFKWLPRPGSRNKTHRENAKMIMDHLGLNKFEYQKLLSSNSDTVEQKICAREFDKIDYSKIPSGAHLRHVRSFFNNDPGRFTEYMNALADGSGDVKINANAVTPFNILTRYMSDGRNQSTRSMFDSMFDAMEDFTGGQSVLPMIDTSGSMHMKSNNGLVIDVAVSLGVYCAMKNTSEKYNNLWLTFNTHPRMGVLQSKSFIDNCISVREDNDWGGTTNIQEAYSKILKIAKDNNLPQEELPKYLIIFSDMQFDQWGGLSCYYKTPSLPDAHMLALKQFSDAGYEAPTLVYWNLSSDVRSALPITTTSTGAMICTGQSPTVLPSIFNSSGVLDLIVNTLKVYDPAIQYILGTTEE